MANLHVMRYCLYIWLWCLWGAGWVTICTAQAPDNKTMLHKAVRKGDINQVHHLLAQGADINAEDNNRATPLHIAVNQGSGTMVKLLLSQGAHINSVGGRMQSTPLHYAAATGNATVAEILITAGADINAVDYQHFRPLHYAVQNGHIKMVKLLLKSGVVVHTKTRQGVTPLMYAVLYQHTGIEHLLTHHGAQSDILCATIRGDIRTVTMILTKEPYQANLHASSKEYWTPLFWAVFCEHMDIVKLLVNSKADITHQAQQMTPLYLAVRKGNSRITRFLIDHKAPLNTKLSRDKTVLHIVSTKTCAQLLVDNGADIHARDTMGWTPLHCIMTTEGHQRVAGIIRVKRPQIDRKALRQLAMQEQSVIAKILIEHQADIHARDNYGLTPLDLAQTAGLDWLLKRFDGPTQDSR